MYKKIKDNFLRKKVFVLNIFSLLVLQGGQYLLTLATLPYLARVLSPSQFGIYGISLGIAQYGLVITNYGFDLSASRSIAISRGDNESIYSIFWSVMSAKFILALVSVSSIFIMCIWVPSCNEFFLPIMLASLQVFGAVLLPSWFFQGIEKLWGITIANLIARFSGLPLFFVLVTKPDNLVCAIAIQTGITIFSGVVGFFIVIVNKYVHFRKITFRSICYQLSEGFSLFVSNIAISLYTMSTIVIMGFFSNSENAGLFSGVDKVRSAISGIFIILSGAIYPRINSVLLKNRTGALLLIKKVFIYQSVVTISCSIFLYIFSHYVVLYGLGEHYMNAVSSLKIMSPLVFLVTTSVVFANYMLLSFGYKKIFMSIPLFMSIFHIAICIPLCYFYGVNGGSISILCTEFVTNAILLFFINRKGILKEIIHV